jgi:hypothetical protein
MSTSNEATAATTSTHFDNLFHENIIAVLEQIVARFPDNEQAKGLLTMAPMANLDPRLKSVFRTEWREFTLDSRDTILAQDTDHVCQLFETSNYPQAKAIGIHLILRDPTLDPASRQAIWEYMKLLTVVSHAGTPTAIKAPETQAKTPAAPITPPKTPVMTGGVPAAVNGASATQQKPDMEKAMKTLLDSMPKMVQTFNNLMKDDDGSNVFAQMAKQFTNPGALQTGVPNNLAMNLMAEQQNAPTMMQQVQEQLAVSSGAATAPSLTVEDIVSKLEKLERIESLRAKKKQARK